MKLLSLTLIIICISFFPHNASASALIGTSCFVTAEVINVDSETKYLDSGEEYDSRYLLLKILSVDEGTNCPVQSNQIFKAIDNNEGSFQPQDIIRAGIEPGSSMGPEGAISFLQWSNLTYENGDQIISYKNGRSVIDSLQSDSNPIVIETNDGIFDTEDSQNDTIAGNTNWLSDNYIYFLIPTIIILGLSMFWYLLRKRKVR